jgi:hypothetical protein
MLACLRATRWPNKCEVDHKSEGPLTRLDFPGTEHPAIHPGHAIQPTGLSAWNLPFAYMHKRPLQGSGRDPLNVHLGPSRCAAACASDQLAYRQPMQRAKSCDALVPIPLGDYLVDRCSARHCIAARTRVASLG